MDIGIHGGQDVFMFGGVDITSDSKVHTVHSQVTTFFSVFSLIMNVIPVIYQQFDVK